jgi:hypothetical protein
LPPPGWADTPFGVGCTKPILLAGSIVAAIHLHGQIPLSSLLNFTYTQNFDSLASSGTGNAWVNNSTIPGWYLSRTTYNANAGGSSTVSAYSYGSSGSTDRALGSVAGNGATTYMGVRFVNDTPTTIYPAFNLSYVGEQWRKANNGSAHRLEFGYKISSSPLTNPADTGFSSVVELDFVSPVFGATTATALEGNLAGNRLLLEESVVFNQLLEPGEEIMFRWADPDNSNADHGLAIDNLSIEIPEGDTLPGLIVVGLFASAMRLRRNWASRRAIADGPGATRQ